MAVDKDGTNEDVDWSRACQIIISRNRKKYRLTNTTAEEGEEEGCVAVGVVGDVRHEFKAGNDWVLVSIYLVYLV